MSAVPPSRGEFIEPILRYLSDKESIYISMATRDKRNTAIYTAFDDYDAGDLPVPEKSLLRAILLNAIADMNRNDENSRRAKDYFLSREDDYIFSFQAICSYLQINPHHILILVGLEEGPKRRTQETQIVDSDSPELGVSHDAGATGSSEEIKNV